MIPKLEIFTGDVRDVLLNRCKPKSVHVVVTSPPYHGLRSYGTPPQLWPAGSYFPMHGCPSVSYPEWTGELGQEPDIIMFIGHIVEVFAAARPILRDDGTLWVNFGDSYSADSKWGGASGGKNYTSAEGQMPRERRVTGLGEKQLMMQPARVALALQADGWVLRRDIVWNKKNPMPESVTDRPTCSHEFVYLFAKNTDYFYDAEAIKEAGSPASHARLSQENIENQRGVSKQDAYLETGAVGKKSRDRAPQTIIKALARKLAAADSGVKNNTSFDAACNMPVLSRNCRDVWTFGTEPFPGAHYATFPTALVRRPVMAGTSAAGCCPKCGTPWERIVDVTSIRRDELPEGHPDHRPGRYPVKSVGNDYDHGGCQRVSSSETLGWQPGCACDGIDRRLIKTPTGESAGEDPSLEVGRAGMERPRGENEGTRPITRYEQAQYAAQLKAINAEGRESLEAECGKECFAHYLRTDVAGARPIPALLLAQWIEMGVLTKVEVPPHGPGLDPVPCTVMDVFGGSGTVGEVALEYGRNAILIDLDPRNEEFQRDRCAAHDGHGVFPGM